MTWRLEMFPFTSPLQVNYTSPGNINRSSANDKGQEASWPMSVSTACVLKNDPWIERPWRIPKRYHRNSNFLQLWTGWWRWEARCVLRPQPMGQLLPQLDEYQLVCFAAEFHWICGKPASTTNLGWHSVGVPAVQPSIPYIGVGTQRTKSSALHVIKTSSLAYIFCCLSPLIVIIAMRATLPSSLQHHHHHWHAINQRTWWRDSWTLDTAKNRFQRKFLCSCTFWTRPWICV